MTKLTKIFGAVVPTFFTNGSDGVSISEVARRQAEAKQPNDSFWARISDAKEGVFRKTLSFVGAGNGNEQTIAGPTITVAEIREYPGVANRNALTAVLMHGVKLYKQLQQQLQVVDLRLFVTESLPVEPLRPEEPQPPVAPQRPAAATFCSTEQFMDLSNIDDMIASLKSEVLAQFDFAFWKRANELNARAAVLGKLLSEQGSLFREFVRPLPKGGETMTQSGVVITRWDKAYSQEQLNDFSKQRDALKAEYDGLQKQLNGLKKQIKDAVRAYNLEQERSYQTAYGDYQLAVALHQKSCEELHSLYRDARQQYLVSLEQVRASAETFRQEALAELATLRVRTQ